MRKSKATFNKAQLQQQAQKKIHSVVKPKVLFSGYGNYGASYARKSLLSFISSGHSPDDDITYNLKTLRARSRELSMGSSLARSALNTLSTNTIGTGLMLNANIDGERLGLSIEETEKWKNLVETEWKLYSESIACDASRKLTFYQLQFLAFYSTLLSGDCFIALPYIKRPESPYELKIYVIEGDRVCDPYDGTNFLANTLEGVELGPYGEPKYYYVAKIHPGSTLFNDNTVNQEWKKVPVFGARTGRRNMLHLMANVERPEQRRGVPLLAPVIESLKTLSRYTDAELMAALVSGLFTVFITHENSSAGISGAGGFFDDAFENVTTEDDIAMGNGAIVNLPEGAKAESVNPGRPNSNFEGFVNAIVTQIGSCLGMSKEVILKEFNSSYSASRAALLEFWKTTKFNRQWFKDGFCQPIYEEWLSEAVSLGRINAPGFFEDPTVRKLWCQAEWAGDAPGSIEPVKEANAALIRIKSGLSTIEKEAAEISGLDVRTIAKQRGFENKLFSDNDVVLTSINDRQLAQIVKEDEGDWNNDDE